MKQILLRPGSIKGINTSTDPLAVGPDYLAYGQNVRLNLGPITARPGDQDINASIASGTVRGKWVGYQDGTYSVFVAIAASSKVSIYRSTNGGVSFTNVSPDGTSPSTAYYGDTRLTDSLTVPVRFCIVKDRPFADGTAYDLLFIQNGIDSPRIFGKSQATGTGVEIFSSTYPGAYGMSVVTQPDQVPNDGNLTAFTAFANAFAVGDFSKVGSITTTPSSNAGITASSQTSSTLYNFIKMVVTNSGDMHPYVVGNSVTIPFTAHPNASKSQQFVVIGTCPDDPDWGKKLVISVSDGTHTAVIYDPKIGSQIPSQIEVGTPTCLGSVVPVYGRQIAFALPSSVAGMDWTAITSITFGYSEVPSININIYFYVLAFGGQVQGGANFGVSYISADTRQEGPVQIITTKNNGTLNLGGGMANTPVGAVAGVVNDITIVEDPRFWYDYFVTASSVSTAQANAGIDFANLYVNENGTIGYYYIQSKRLVTWNSGSHTWVNAAGSVQGFAFDNSFGVNWVRDQSKPALNSDTICTQIGTAMCSASSRFFVAVVGTCYYSRVDRPFAFSAAASGDGDPLSSSSFTLDGETIQVFAVIGSLSGAAESLNTPVVGSATILVLTNVGLFSLSGFDATSLNRPLPEGPYGTLSPMSLSRSRFGFYWLDQYGQPQFYDGKLSTIGWNIIDNLTVPIPESRKVWVSGACAQNRYFLGYTPEGGSSNTNCLVYNEVFSAWESVDTAEDDFSFLEPFYSNGVVGVIVLSTASGTAKCWQTSKPGDTSDIDLEAMFRSLTAGDAKGEPFIQRVNLGAIGILMENNTGAELTVTTTRDVLIPIVGDTSPTNGSIVIPDTTDIAWQYDGLGTGVQGASVQPGISATVPGGTILYMVTCMIDPAMEGIERP